MLRLLQFLWTGSWQHEHVWEDYQLVKDYTDSGSRCKPSSIIFIRQCKHCGELTKFKVGY